MSVKSEVLKYFPPVWFLFFFFFFSWFDFLPVLVCVVYFVGCRRWKKLLYLFGFGLIFAGGARFLRCWFSGV